MLQWWDFVEATDGALVYYRDAGDVNTEIKRVTYDQTSPPVQRDDTPQTKDRQAA